MRDARPIRILLAALACTPLIACPVHHVTVADDEPILARPSHPPAHGYRRKHEQAYHSHTGSVELVFDSGLGVYVVVGMSDHYFWNGSYLWVRDGSWWVGTYLDGDWRPRDASSLPDGLRAKYAKAKKPKKSHPAKMR